MEILTIVLLIVVSAVDDVMESLGFSFCFTPWLLVWGVFFFCPRVALTFFAGFINASASASSRRNTAFSSSTHALAALVLVAAASFSTAFFSFSK